MKPRADITMSPKQGISETQGRRHHESKTAHKRTCALQLFFKNYQCMCPTVCIQESSEVEASTSKTRQLNFFWGGGCVGIGSQEVTGIRGRLSNIIISQLITFLKICLYTTRFDSSVCQHGIFFIISPKI